MKIYLDPGHGGTDPGAVGNGLKEKDITLKICNRIRQLLQNQYENVLINMSRTGDTVSSLKIRTDEANRWGADLFLSVHVNSGGGTGFESFVYPSVGSKTTNYQTIIHKEIMAFNDLVDRGRKQANFHVLRESKMPALLTENGFIDHAGDSKLMKSSIWIEKVAIGHATGVAKALNLKLKLGVTEPTISKPVTKEPAPSPSFNKAIKKGIIKGYGGGKMGAHDPLTRDQMAIILDRLGLLD